MQQDLNMIRLPDVLKLAGIGRTNWLDRVKAGTAPAPYKMGSAALWRRSEVEAWLASFINGTPYQAPRRREVSKNIQSAQSIARIKASQAYRGEARERIATACLAAMIGTEEELQAAIDGKTLVQVACDYADSLLLELQRREERAAT